MTQNATVVIKDKSTGQYVTQAALELWEDGHDLDGLDLWADEVGLAAWISRDDAPTGMDMERFEFVDVASIA